MTPEWVWAEGNAEYMRHWEDRAEAAEARLTKAMKALDEAMYFLDPEPEDILKGAGIYRIVKTYAELGAVIPADWADALRNMEGFKDND